jgi:peptidoglycan hydrolase CwlO-like protein
MNKKIISVFFLLIVMVSIAFAYVHLNQNETNENQYESSGKNINNEDVANEIDGLFIDENDEVEIGEMV